MEGSWFCKVSIEKWGFLIRLENFLLLSLQFEGILSFFFGKEKVLEERSHERRKGMEMYKRKDKGRSEPGQREKRGWREGNWRLRKERREGGVPMVWIWIVFPKGAHVLIWSPEWRCWEMLWTFKRWGLVGVPEVIVGMSLKRTTAPQLILPHPPLPAL